MSSAKTFFHRYLGIPYSMHVRDDRGRALKPRATVVFVHGIGNTGAVWDSVIADLPNDLRVITVDLLGFGASPKPEWLRYDVRQQARSLRVTLLRLRVRGPVILVGHSLGSLIAIEYARRYDHLQSLILCSPPLLAAHAGGRKLRTSADNLLRSVFMRVSLADPEQLLKVGKLLTKYKLVTRHFAVDNQNINSYIATLSASIINQTSLDDALHLRMPTHIIRGRFDPVVLAPNLRRLATANPRITLQVVTAGHEVTGALAGACQRAIITAADAANA